MNTENGRSPVVCGAFDAASRGVKTGSSGSSRLTCLAARLALACRILMSGVWTGTLAPLGTRISSIVPASRAVRSKIDFSASISARTSCRRHVLARRDFPFEHRHRLVGRAGADRLHGRDPAVFRERSLPSDFKAQHPCRRRHNLPQRRQDLKLVREIARHERIGPRYALDVLEAGNRFHNRGDDLRTNPQVILSS